MIDLRDLRIRNVNRLVLLLGCVAFTFGTASPAQQVVKAAPQKEGVQVVSRMISVERITFISNKPYGEILTKLKAGVGHTDMAAFGKKIAAAQTEPELEKVVNDVVGSRGLMEFAEFDMGAVLQKELGPKASRSTRFLIGNPLVMKSMAKYVPDAASYAPVTILVDERPDGVHLTYDTMASHLAPYGNDESLKVARKLDEEVRALLSAAAK